MELAHRPLRARSRSRTAGGLVLAALLTASTALGADGVRRVSVRKLALIPTLAGAATLLTGTALLSVGYARADAGFQHAGWTAFGVGLGLVAIGALTCALGGASKVSATVMLSPDGTAGLAAFGVW